MNLIDNAATTFKIKAELISQLGLTGVNVDTEDGVVTMRGTVPFENFREVAEQIALQHGARKVVNELAIDPIKNGEAPLIPEDWPRVTTPEGAPKTESPPLDEAVHAALVADPRVNEHLVILQVENGVVYLSGRQDTVQARDAATEITAHVPGVLGVVNDLEVMPSV